VGRRGPENGYFAILDQSREHGAAWVYFNHLRLFELAKNLGVSFKTLARYRGAVTLGHCDRRGHLLPRCDSTGWMYEGGDGIALYQYVGLVLEATLEKLTVLNISNDLERGVLSALLKPGDFILVSGAHRFAKEISRERRTGQTTRGLRSANKVAVEFTIDRWEATSSSAHSRWLSGQVDVTSIIKVSTITRTVKGKLLIKGTALAIAQGFSGFKTREYSTFPYRAGVYIADDDDEVEDGLDDPRRRKRVSVWSVQPASSPRPPTSISNNIARHRQQGSYHSASRAGCHAAASGRRIVGRTHPDQRQ
jgi:hypothetical protein